MLYRLPFASSLPQFFGGTIAAACTVMAAMQAAASTTTMMIRVLNIPLPLLAGSVADP